MATLLSCCTTALREMGRYTVPTTIVGNTDPTAVRLLALANRTGRTLAIDYNWSVLITDYTFSTSNGVSQYALPSAFNRLANITVWNRTQNAPLRGPSSPVEWQAMNSSAVTIGSPFNQNFRIAGGYFNIYPTPTATETIAYTYYSNQWISGKAEFSLDADVPLIDSDLITIGLRWRFLQAMGDSYENEQREYRDRLDSLQAADGGKAVISFNRRTRFAGDNLPEVGFG